jgi:hypothetical protein
MLINALDEDADGSLSVTAKRIGGPLLFGRIWERLGIPDVPVSCWGIVPSSSRSNGRSSSACYTVFSSLDRILTVPPGWQITYPGRPRAQAASFLTNHGLGWRGDGREGGQRASVKDIIEEKRFDCSREA